MSATEYALVHSAVDCELRACAGMLAVWLMLFLKIALLGWLLLASVWLTTRIASRRIVTRLAFVAILFLSQTVLAQPRPQPNLLSSSAAMANSTSLAPPKSRATALTYSLSMTILPAAAGGLIALVGESGNHNSMTLFGLGLGSAGVILGPGAGHAYAGKTDRFWHGVAIRGTTAIFTTLLLVSAFDNSDFGAGIIQAMIALAVGGGICLVSAIYDISKVGSSVDDYNKEHGFNNLTLKPTFITAHNAPGIVLTLTF